MSPYNMYIMECSQLGESTVYGNCIGLYLQFGGDRNFDLCLNPLGSSLKLHILYYWNMGLYMQINSKKDRMHIYIKSMPVYQIEFMLQLAQEDIKVQLFGSSYFGNSMAIKYKNIVPETKSCYRIKQETSAVSIGTATRVMPYQLSTFKLLKKGLKSVIASYTLIQNCHPLDFPNCPNISMLKDTALQETS